MTRGDRAAWLAEGERNGWTAENLKATWPWRLPIVRHVRFVWHSWMAGIQTTRFASVGIGLGGVASFDVWVLIGIRRGWV